MTSGATASDTAGPHRPSRKAAALAAVAFVAGAQIAGGIGVPFTDPGSDWYLNLQKAPFNPPPWVFGPVWGVLYVVIGLAAFIAWLAPPGKNRTLALR